MIVRINENGNTKQVDLNSFGKDVVSFGRLPSCDIVLKSDRISRVHGAFYLDKGVWIIEDIKSRNGITMDGGKVKRATAKVGREFILYDSKDNGKVSITILQPSSEVQKPNNKVEKIKPVKVVNIDEKINNDDTENLVEKPKKNKKKRNIIIGFVAAVLLITVVVVVLLNVKIMSKEEKAYYRYLADLIQDADDASEVNIIVEESQQNVHYNYYAIADFDGDKTDELFILKEIHSGFSKDSVGEFYEYVDGEVEFENSFAMGSDKYPFTFYDNGVVKAGNFEDNIEICYAGVHKGYLEDIGFLPFEGARGETFNSYDGAICIECDDDYNDGVIYYIWNDQWDEMTRMTDSEYTEIFEFDADVVDVEICEFDIEDIAQKNKTDVEEYAVYSEIDHTDEFVADDIYENMDITYGAWTISARDDGTASIFEYNGPQREIEIPVELGGYKISNVGGIDVVYLEKVIIPDGIKGIYDEAFEGCKYLTSVTIPGSVEIIGMRAFNRCDSLENVVVSEGVKIIDGFAFAGCDNLTVELPESLERLHEKSIGYNLVYDDSAEKYKHQKAGDCTIIGVKGTIAEDYAIDNNFEFEEK